MFGKGPERIIPGEPRPAVGTSGQPPGSGSTSHQAAQARLARALGAAALLGALLVLGSGCTHSGPGGAMEPQTETFFSQVRPASGDTARLIRNAHYYRLMGQPQLALKELEEAYALAPDNLKIVNTLAQNYEELGEFSRAQKLYQEALSLVGANPALKNNLCYSYYLAGRWDQAQACFQEALAHDPGNKTARNNLGLLYCRQGRIEEARRLWQEAEGSAGAAEKVDLALAALGMEPPAPLARSQGGRPAEPAAPAQAKAAPPAPTQQAATPPSAPAARLQVPKPPAATVAKPQAPPVQPGGKPAGVTSPAAAPPTSPSPATAKQVAAAPPTPAPARPRPLTAKELTETAIEVRNGTPTPGLAHQTRSTLSLEGFNVAQIGNHIDWGAEVTVIYYRPEAQRVAQALAHRFFPISKLVQSQKLKDGTDVKILLGHDLLQRHELMARLSAEGTD